MMSKFMDLVSNTKNVAALVTALAAAGGVFYGVQNHLDTTYASTIRVDKLEKRLSLQELKELLQDALEELYFWRKQARKHPEDLEIKEKLKEAEDHIVDIKKRIKEHE